MAETDDIQRITMRKVAWRLLPFLMASYLVSYVDRVNSGFAALTMTKSFLSVTAFGLGGTAFFVAYVLFEIPSNLGLQRFGARRWIARIMVSWGIVGLGSAFVVGPWSFAISRFLLGAAEAGFFPGVVLYLTYWFPRAYRAGIVAAFMVAIPLSNLIGSPVSALLLELDGLAGLHGWQWLFVVESIPAILLGCAALRLLPSRPGEASWLTASELAWLEHELAAGTPASRGDGSIRTTLKSGRVWALALVYCGSSATSNALSIWQPQILKSFGLTTLMTGVLNMIPFGVAAVAMIFWARRADRTGERVWSTALPLALTAIALLGTIATSSLTITIILLSAALVGNYAIKGPFWALATELLPVSGVAGGLAAINAFAHFGTAGAAGLLGIIQAHTGSFPLALLPLSFLSLVGAVLVVSITRRGSDAESRDQLLCE